MRSLLCLLACLTLLGGCASKPKDPSGIWINQAAIDAAVDSQHLREALLAYGPNLEWNLNSARQQATFSNGFELADGQLSALADGLWQVSFYGEHHEVLKPEGELLIQQASATWPEQRFARPKVKVDAAAPAGSSFEYSLYEAFLAGSWKIRSGPGEGGLVIFHADGKLDGLPGAERFALCLAGHCAAMGGEDDSLPPSCNLPTTAEGPELKVVNRSDMPSDAPAAVLNDSVAAGRWPPWFAARAVLRSTMCATDDSGTGAPTLEGT